MQKKLIALAIAGLSGAAFAQSNVTIYGVMDATQEVIKTSNSTAANTNVKSQGRLASNSSYIGFKGAESLGNGLTAVFQYESSITSDAAGAMAGGRDSYIGVAGGFGTVAMGNLTHPVRAMGAKVDMNPGASTAGFTGSMYGEVLGVKTGSDERASNAIAYISPNFNGFTGVVAYVNLERANDNAPAGPSYNGKAWQIAGSYENGPLYVGLAYDKHKDPGALGSVMAGVLDVSAGTSTATWTTNLTPALGAGPAAAVGAILNGNTYNDELKITRLAATYSLPSNTKLSFLWDKQKYTVSGSGGQLSALAGVDTQANRTSWMLGAKQSFGVNDVWLQYAVAKDATGAICDTYTALGLSCGDTSAKQWTLGYAYNLSKRTMVHALYTKINNDARVKYDHYVNGVGARAGADSTVYGLGLRHTF